MQHQVSPKPVRKGRSSVVIMIHDDDVSNANLVGETRGHELYVLRRKGETA
jgi:hypothetical protein